ncbi:unnamed protein product [Paramecium pentaurelia]|uniref:Transmembrane protein n=1 Tax=Paramecium pentaurelia TaxID=43138 RepID=A0A8S1WQH4_9CILI|nr:unnamed protein product [Paramecium pentaurelia]
MTESIQFRGPLEVEGPDDLDDDDNYMRPGLETTGLQNRKQKDQPTKKSLYIAIICFFIGLFYFYFTYEQPISIHSEFATQTTFGCNRQYYWTKQGCEPNPIGCILSVEKTSSCVICESTYYLSLQGICIEECKESNGQFCTSKNNTIISNIYKPKTNTYSYFEIPYILIHSEHSAGLLYVSDVELFKLEPYLSLNYTIVKFEDYFLLNNEELHLAFKEFQTFIEKTLLDGTLIKKSYVAFQDKSQGLLFYLASQNITDNIFLVQPTLLEEKQFYDNTYEIKSFDKLFANRTFNVTVLHTGIVPDELKCKKNTLRLLPALDNLDEKDNSNQIEGTKIEEEVDCFKIEESQIIEKIVHPN